MMIKVFSSKEACLESTYKNKKFEYTALHEITEYDYQYIAYNDDNEIKANPENGIIRQYSTGEVAKDH
mgnify:CR=1 FL=1